MMPLRMSEQQGKPQFCWKSFCMLSSSANKHLCWTLFKHCETIPWEKKEHVECSLTNNGHLCGFSFNALNFPQSSVGHGPCQGSASHGPRMCEKAQPLSAQCQRSHLFRACGCSKALRSWEKPKSKRNSFIDWTSSVRKESICIWWKDVGLQTTL